MMGLLDQLPLAAGEGSFWMPPKGSTFAFEVDRVFYFIFWVSALFFVLITGLAVFFVIRYRRREGVAPAETPHHNLALELTWSAIPLVLVFVMFYMGVKAMINIETPPSRAYEILVTAQRWNWLFTYPNGYVDKDLHVPLDVPVRLTMRSEDVIHSFYVPSFRIKKDIVPGKYTKTWFRATEPGRHVLFCAEYCGTQHSDMLADIVVHPAGEFERWLEDAASFVDKMPPAEAGRRLYEVRGCKQCHSVDGTAGIGPSFKGLFGAKQALTNGSIVEADENYIRESIMEPQAKVSAGYDPVMPTYKGRLKDAEITAIIEYLKTLAAPRK